MALGFVFRRIHSEDLAPHVMLDGAHHCHVNVLEGLALDRSEELSRALALDQVRLGARVEAGNGHAVEARTLPQLVRGCLGDVEGVHGVLGLQEGRGGAVSRVGRLVLLPPVAEEEELQDVRVGRRERQLPLHALAPARAEGGVVLHHEDPGVVGRALAGLAARGQPAGRDVLPEAHVRGGDGDHLGHAAVVVVLQQLLDGPGRAVHDLQGGLHQRRPDVRRRAGGHVHAGQEVPQRRVQLVRAVVGRQELQRLAQLRLRPAVEAPDGLRGHALGLQALARRRVVLLVDGDDQGLREGCLVMLCRSSCLRGAPLVPCIPPHPVRLNAFLHQRQRREPFGIHTAGNAGGLAAAGESKPQRQTHTQLMQPR
mmetsp:Transcript_108629/g.350665  ORF Transcript_108629/g.350665 Transcript_108629/m.350665 type:complete len:369 (+) Transcript_108629:123-1229(+)